MAATGVRLLEFPFHPGRLSAEAGQRLEHGSDHLLEHAVDQVLLAPRHSRPLAGQLLERRARAVMDGDEIVAVDQDVDLERLHPVCAERRRSRIANAEKREDHLGVVHVAAAEDRGGRVEVEQHLQRVLRDVQQLPQAPGSRRVEIEVQPEEFAALPERLHSPRLVVAEPEEDVPQLGVGGPHQLAGAPAAISGASGFVRSSACA